jgi:hypothetical protein
MQVQNFYAIYISLSHLSKYSPPSHFAQTISMAESITKITTKSTAGQVQEVLQYSNIQWKRFLVRYIGLRTFVTSLTHHPQIITTEEAPGLGTKSSWRDVPAQQQQSLINDVKERLRQEEIPRPSDDLEKAIQWRMPQVFKAHKAKSASKSTRCRIVPPTAS